jgi:hypothetical protein
MLNSKPFEFDINALEFDNNAFEFKFISSNCDISIF